KLGEVLHFVHLPGDRSRCLELLAVVQDLAAAGLQDGHQPAPHPIALGPAITHEDRGWHLWSLRTRGSGPGIGIRMLQREDCLIIHPSKSRVETPATRRSRRF